MIENKVVTIKKSNTIDKGWTLVKPYAATFRKNKHFCAFNVSDIVRAITNCTQVNLILSEPCLSLQIIKELVWVNKYANINVIARSQVVIDYYKQLTFNKITIDKSIDFNYIAVLGKINAFALISGDYVSVDGSLNQAYFEQKSINEKCDFLLQAKSVIFIDENNDKDYSKYFDACLKAKIPTAYLVATKAHTQELVHKFLKLEATLLCSHNVKNGIVYFTGDGRIYCADLTNKGILTSVEIESVDYYIGQPFECLKFADFIEVKEIPQGCYVCDNGNITPLNIKKQKVIDRSVQINKMKDFVEANFDKSETELHNKYCTEAEEVIYNFTLIPPLFNSDKFSDIYKGVEGVYAKWKGNFTSIDLKTIIGYLTDIELNECGLCLLCEEIIAFDKRLSGMVAKHNYKKFYTDIKTFDDLITYSTIDDYCKELFSKVNTESSDTKFDKFDKEIAGYRQTIEEKQALIEQGIEVLSNKRRVEILEKKITDLTAMKQKFAGGSASRDSKQLEVFMALCKQIIDGEYIEKKREIDSIGNVLETKEVAKSVKLETFVKTYLYEFYTFIEVAKGIVKELESLDIPTDYIVYEQSGKNVIAIESEQEYYDTEKIRKHFNLHCVARR